MRRGLESGSARLGKAGSKYVFNFTMEVVPVTHWPVGGATSPVKPAEGRGISGNLSRIVLKPLQPPGIDEKKR